MFSFLHNFVPQPILFHFGIITIYWYGLFIVLGVVSALILILHLAKKFQIDPEIYLGSWFLFGIIWYYWCQGL